MSFPFGSAGGVRRCFGKCPVQNVISVSFLP